MKKKKLLFLTGTRADYGKLKSLLKQVENHAQFDLFLFVTGMHMLSKYGSTWKEIEKDGFQNTYHYINQKSQAQMDITLSNTILGLSNYIHEIKPDIIVIHGDRLEALAGAMVGAFNNISVVHIEGGEVSGTIDESIRHAISKFAHVHLVSNEQAKKRIIQLGEKSDMIHVIGSPDIDIMLSSDLPQLQEVKERYEIKFDTYSILMYHPVTTNLENLQSNIKNIIKALLQTDRNYIIIFPNNDEGSQIILDEYAKLEGISKIKLFPSMRFEYFLTLLKNADFLIGNSSTGIRETEVYGIPTIDLGNRQEGRYLPEVYANLVHCNEITDDILKAIQNLPLHQPAYSSFGEGESDSRFIELIQQEDFWNITLQKKFVDQVYLTSR